MSPTSQNHENVIRDLLDFEEAERTQLEKFRTQLNAKVAKERKKNEDELLEIKNKIEEAESHAKTAALEKIKDDVKKLKSGAQSERKQWQERTQKNRKKALTAARQFLLKSITDVAY